MIQEKHHKETRVSASAIWFGALIGIGFCIMLGALCGGISSSISFESNKLPNDTVLFLISAATVILLSFAFFIAALVDT